MNYSTLLNGVDSADTSEINDRIRRTKDHQLKRIDYFLSLESNRANKERHGALQEYKNQLLEFDIHGVNALKFLVQKGEALEQW